MFQHTCIYKVCIQWSLNIYPYVSKSCLQRHNASIAIKDKTLWTVCRCLDKIALQSDTIWPSTSAQTDGEDEKNKIIPHPTLVKPYFNYFV